MKYFIAFIAGFGLRSVFSYVSFYGIEGTVYWFLDIGYLVEGVLTLDWYLISRCFDTLFLI
jgi:hypothetical protein